MGRNVGPPSLALLYIFPPWEVLCRGFLPALQLFVWMPELCAASYRVQSAGWFYPLPLGR